ncbi:MAG TPA: hypothetical protein VKP67_23760 [Xanthobacteraceae bacterium]|nr:hypothetical protein [Xanthobacteraceae bacterium]
MPYIANAKSQSLIAGVIAAALNWPAFAAESSAVPNFSPDSRTGWIAGVPDGETPIGDDFLQPASGPGPVTFDRAHPFIDNRVSRRLGKSATNRVADLSNPILQPWVREELRKLNQRALTETMLWTPKERCWPIGVPGFLLYPVTPVYFLQTPKQVVMIWEEDHMFRHVYLTDQHSPNVKPSWFGESIGHYENGGTLVVDTIGLNSKTFVDSYQTPHTEQLHVVERFRIIEDGKALEVTARVEDPGAFTMPWTALQRYRRAEQGPMVEAVCAENNDKFFNYDIEPIPMAHKPDF